MPLHDLDIQRSANLSRQIPHLFPDLSSQSRLAVLGDEHKVISQPIHCMRTFPILRHLRSVPPSLLKASPKGEGVHPSQSGTLSLIFNAALVSGFAMAVYTPLTLYMNLRYLPPSAKPRGLNLHGGNCLTRLWRVRPVLHRERGGAAVVLIPGKLTMGPHGLSPSPIDSPGKQSRSRPRPKTRLFTRATVTRAL